MAWKWAQEAAQGQRAAGLFLSDPNMCPWEIANPDSQTSCLNLNHHLAVCSFPSTLANTNLSAVRSFR